MAREEINFIRPQEVYEDGSSLVRYRSYDGKEILSGLKAVKGTPTKKIVTAFTQRRVSEVVEVILDPEYDFETEGYAEIGVAQAILNNAEESLIVAQLVIGDGNLEVDSPMGKKFFAWTPKGYKEAITYLYQSSPYYYGGLTPVNLPAGVSLKVKEYDAFSFYIIVGGLILQGEHNLLPQNVEL